MATAYERAGIAPTGTTHLYKRGRSQPRPSADQLQIAWETEGTFSGVGRQLGISHTTAAVWLAEIGVFAHTTPALPRSVLLDSIERQWPVPRIATENQVSVRTVRIELHRHELFVALRQRHRTPQAP